MTTTDIAMNVALMVAVSLLAATVMLTVPNLYGIRAWMRRNLRAALRRSVRRTRAITSGQLLRAGRS
jgi:hypothetical protein